MTTARRTGSHAGDALGQAAALRIRPADIGHGWGELSTLLTQLADRYTGTVTVRCFPEASAPAPGSIHRPSGTILLDGDLLATCPRQLDLRDHTHLASLAVLLGVQFHEIGHERHTHVRRKLDAPKELRWAIAMLEEPRMEAQAIREYPDHQAFLRAATYAINIAELPDHATSRRDAALLGVLICGRRHAGTLLASDATDAEAIVEGALGAADAQRLDRLLAHTVTLADDNHTGMHDAARELEDIIGDDPPDEQEPDGPDGTASSDAAGSRDDDEHPQGDPLERIKQQLHNTAHQAGEDIARELDRDAAGRLLKQLAEQLTSGTAAPPPGRRLPGWGIGMPDGTLIPPYGNRPAIPFERAARRRLAVILQRARSQHSAREGRILPPGRFNGTGAVRQAAERVRGAIVTGAAFRQRVRIQRQLWSPALHLYVDNSGSMAIVEAVLGSVIWVTCGAIADLGGRSSVATFGNASELIARAGRPPRLVPELQCGGGTEHLADAITHCDADLPLRQRGRPRLAVIVSDGMWLDRNGHAKRLIDQRLADGVALIHVGVGFEPVAHGDCRTAVIEPDNIHRVADVIAEALVGVLSGRR